MNLFANLRFVKRRPENSLKPILVAYLLVFMQAENGLKIGVDGINCLSHDLLEYRFEHDSVRVRRRDQVEIKVLGASGSEAPGHNSPALLVDDFLLLDAGTVSISLDRPAQCKITHILLTHAHLDHIKGIPSLVDNLVAGKQGYQLTIMSGKDVLADLRKNIFNNRIWPDFTVIPNPLQPVMRYAAISTRSPVHVGGYKVSPIRVNHVVPAYGYLLEDHAHNCLLYTGDSGPTEQVWKRVRGRRVRVLIIEVSFPNELEGLALTSGHLTPALFAKEMEKMAVHPERIFITHVKPYYHQTIREQIARVAVNGISFLEDNMLISL
jgi:ribonuclease BN (tRNA processing enzyme)